MFFLNTRQSSNIETVDDQKFVVGIGAPKMLVKTVQTEIKVREEFG